MVFWFARRRMQRTGKADIDSQKVNIALLREMAEHGVIEPVAGYGKGKYRFRQQER